MKEKKSEKTTGGINCLDHEKREIMDHKMFSPGKNKPQISLPKCKKSAGHNERKFISKFIYGTGVQI